MRVCVSHLAWQASERETVAQLLRARGVQGIEAVPGMMLADPWGAGAAEARAVRDWWTGEGFAIAAMQSVLFGRPELQLLAEGAGRKALVDALEHMLKLAGVMGCGVVVLGSPKNRLKGDLAQDVAMERACEVLREVGGIAQDEGTCLVVEANVAAYGGDFLTTHDEVAELVARVGHAGVGLHLDTGNLLLADEGHNMPGILTRLAPQAKHVHVSAPQLETLDTVADDVHARLGNALRDGGYAGWVSVEVKRQDGDVSAALARSLDVMARRYVA